MFGTFSISCTFTENKELHVPTILQQRNVPEAVRSLSTMASHDYVDLFTVTTNDDRSAEQWARAAVDRAAGLTGQLVWRVLLGLRLTRSASPDRVAGWKVVHRDDSRIVLEAASWCLTAQIVVHVGDAQVSVATFIRYDRPIAAIVWTPLSAGHRQAMPGLLRRAARLVASDGRTT
jgi:hypothetical protein